jgi:hypothetical protein
MPTDPIKVPMREIFLAKKKIVYLFKPFRLLFSSIDSNFASGQF